MNTKSLVVRLDRVGVISNSGDVERIEYVFDAKRLFSTIYSSGWSVTDPVSMFHLAMYSGRNKETNENELVAVLQHDLLNKSERVGVMYVNQVKDGEVANKITEFKSMILQRSGSSMSELAHVLENYFERSYVLLNASKVSNGGDPTEER